VLILEVLFVSGGKGELFAQLDSNPAAVAYRPPVLSADIPEEDAAVSEDAPPQASPQSVKPNGVAGRSDGNRIVEDADAGYVLISVQGGDFMMGNRTGAIAEESPFHKVHLKPYLIGRSEVTFDLYDRFAEATGRDLPSDNGWGRGSMPVINVSWEDAQALAEWLSLRTGKKYRLPTEAEWEYVAGAGRESSFWWGYDVGENNANCFNCGSQWDRRSPAPVETFKVNPFGLHSTAGNVQEWVQDCYRKGYADAPVDGSALQWAGCNHRVARSGAFNKPADKMKIAKRSHYPLTTRVPHLGIRLAREPD
jgi:formylglycine-generating enzyme required for sulfatase activity